jgi:hypothetical protein
MEKLINPLIEENLKGVNVYHYKGSIWLIHPETKQWVVELTEDGTLWYNHGFFKNLYNYVSLEVIGNEKYIISFINEYLSTVISRAKARNIPLLGTGYIKQVVNDALPSVRGEMSTAIMACNILEVGDVWSNS